MDITIVISDYLQGVFTGICLSFFFFLLIYYFRWVLKTESSNKIARSLEK